MLFKHIKKELININYDYIAKQLFENKNIHLINERGAIYIHDDFYSYKNYYKDLNNCTSKRQCEKLLAINKLLNVAKYLNEDEIKDDDATSMKYTISYNIDNDSFFADWYQTFNNNIVSFKTKKIS